MWSEAVRAVRETQPRAFVFKNVKGLTRSSFSAYFNYTTLQLTYPELDLRLDEAWQEHLSRLERHHSSGSTSALHYQLIPPRVLNAADYGVPQKRERVFFIGFRSDVGADWAFPAATHSLEALRFDQSGRGNYFEKHCLPSRLHRPLTVARANRDELDLKPWRTVRDALAGLPDPKLDPAKGSRWLNHRFQSGAKTYPGHTGSPIDLPAK